MLSSSPSSHCVFFLFLLLLFSIARVAHTSPVIGGPPPSSTIEDEDEDIFNFDLDDEHFSNSGLNSNPSNPSTNTAFGEAESDEETEQISRSQSLRHPEIPYLADRPITCPGFAPQPGGGSYLAMIYPAGLRAESYKNLRQLCWNTRNGHPPGLGCGCKNPGITDEVSCPGIYGIGDDRLLRSGAIGICESVCHCPLNYVSESDSDKSFMPRLSVPRKGASSLPGLNRVSSLSQALGRQKSSGSEGNGGRATTCGNQCHSNRYCSIGGRDSTCGRCVMKEAANPIDRSRASFFTMCMTLNGLSGGRKRSIDTGEEIPDFAGTTSFEPACACNSTYISKACCSEDGSGLVWEAPEMRLGGISKDLLISTLVSQE